MAPKKKEPRYIDANLVKEALIGWETDPTDDEIEYVIDNIPTADVVLRSELAREIIDIIEQRTEQNNAHACGFRNEIVLSVYNGRNDGYRDIKEIIEQKYTGGR